MSWGEAVVEAVDTPDLERRFGGLARLYGAPAYERLRRLRLAVVGVGGVGSWAVEALARCGVAELVLIDLDQVAESNINRQVQALGATLGQAKVQALRERIADIHPGCLVHEVEDFVTPDNWPGLLPIAVDGVIDACDQVRAKAAVAAWARRAGVALVCCGAAGGKRQPHRLEVADLAEVSHDPLLASLRSRLRREHQAPRQGRMGVACVFSREPVAPPAGAATCDTDGTLNCHGYGSSVVVTAAVGLAAAAELIEQVLRRSSD
ncbi:heme biosynthesis protein HemY [Vitreoscilla filiformis]|uniref:Heme biosynthesis protein HemY n=1 Tax=Vitreoscilla filiformis TaxID=63 RepID=A0A221KEY0_VITFI|nr:heme biosynthesis protein HemY [Vitreoscilla filiformis]